jgi:hypothetical protein
MNDLLWLVNHPLRGNVTGIPTLPLLHSTEPELRKLRRTQTDSGRASALELLQELPTRQEVLRLLEPHLSLYSTRMNLGAL